MPLCHGGLGLRLSSPVLPRGLVLADRPVTRESMARSSASLRTVASVLDSSAVRADFITCTEGEVSRRSGGCRPTEISGGRKLLRNPRRGYFRSG